MVNHGKSTIKIAIFNGHVSHWSWDQLPPPEMRTHRRSLTFWDGGDWTLNRTLGVGLGRSPFLNISQRVGLKQTMHKLEKYQSYPTYTIFSGKNHYKDWSSNCGIVSQDRLRRAIHDLGFLGKPPAPPVMTGHSTYRLHVFSSHFSGSLFLLYQLITPAQTCLWYNVIPWNPSKPYPKSRPGGSCPPMSSPVKTFAVSQRGMSVRFQSHPNSLVSFTAFLLLWLAGSEKICPYNSQTWKIGPVFGWFVKDHKPIYHQTTMVRTWDYTIWLKKCLDD